MAEDRLTFYFYSQKEKNEIKKHINKVEAAYKKADIGINEISGGRDKITNQYKIDMWPKSVDDNKGLLLALKYIDTLPSDEIPYVKLELDTTGDKFYYILFNKKLTFIGKKEELDEFLEKGKDTPEKRFYDEHTEENILLVKINFSRKKDIQELYDSIDCLIKENHSEDTLNNVTQIMNSMMEKNGRKNPNFPSSIKFVPRHYGENENIKGNPELLKYLCFSCIDGRNFFIGFEFPKEIDLVHTGILSYIYAGLYDNAEDDENSQAIVALVDCFHIANSRKGVKAKYHSCNLNRNGNKNISEFYQIGEEAFEFGACETAYPTQLWP